MKVCTPRAPSRDFESWGFASNGGSDNVRQVKVSHLSEGFLGVHTHTARAAAYQNISHVFGGRCPTGCAAPTYVSPRSALLLTGDVRLVLFEIQREPGA